MSLLLGVLKSEGLYKILVLICSYHKDSRGTAVSHRNNYQVVQRSEFHINLKPEKKDFLRSSCVLKMKKNLGCLKKKKKRWVVLNC